MHTLGVHTILTGGQLRATAATFVPLNELALVITDDEAEPSLVVDLERTGVEVRLV
jgi:hypothetical protein